jgi:hypothetical protein
MDQTSIKCTKWPQSTPTYSITISIFGSKIYHLATLFPRQLLYVQVVPICKTSYVEQKNFHSSKLYIHTARSQIIEERLTSWKKSLAGRKKFRKMSLQNQGDQIGRIFA